MTIPSQEVLKALLEYDPESGRLTWLPRGVAGWDRQFAGKRAGWERRYSIGYVQRCVGIQGVSLSEHRVIWVYMTGGLPEGEIDHIDRNATNNSWANLRDTSRAIGAQNRSMRSNNISGATGVSWNKTKHQWDARVKVDGKYHLLKRYKDKDQAIHAVLAKRRELGFTDGHGTIAHYRAANG